jgi:UPF0271 protein
MIIDLNADVGEGFDDRPLYALITSANIACGAHAGDETTIDAAVRAAVANGVRIGAHPSYEDRANFGRKTVAMSSGALELSLRQQIERIAGAAARHGATLTHVKPHGALYHDAGRSPALAAAFVRAVVRVDRRCLVVAAPGSALLSEAAARGLEGWAEGFADRGYLADGTLAPRQQSGAVIEDPELAATQAIAIATRQRVRAMNGADVTLPARTLCIHGDAPGALALARRVRQRLEESGVQIRA